uniref:Nitrite reductase n=1 Tax=Macrostomum lignano TaxID=282301 RepID=A0A1I8FTW8_9PLAT
VAVHLVVRQAQEQLWLAHQCRALRWRRQQQRVDRILCRLLLRLGRRLLLLKLFLQQKQLASGLRQAGTGARSGRRGGTAGQAVRRRLHHRGLRAVAGLALRRPRSGAPVPDGGRCPLRRAAA